jgi:putative redox protein
MTTVTNWKEGAVFESIQPDAGKVVLDGDRVKGMSPKAALLAGLAACSGIDIVEILQKMRVAFSDFSIQTDADQTEESPKVFKEISVVYTIKVADADKEKVKKAVDLSMEKYCGVAAMLRKNSAIVSSIQYL